MKRSWWSVPLFVGAAVVLLVVVAGQAGFLSGKPPATSGVRDGRLAPPSSTPNSVSSQAYLHPDNPQSVQAQVAPLQFSGDGPVAMAGLATAIRSMPGATIVSERPDYIYAQYRTPVLHFTDDLELWLDPANNVIQVRSASRVGKGDMGVNRARVEKLRALFSR